MRDGAASPRPAYEAIGPPTRRADLGRAGVALLVAASVLTLLASVCLWSWRTFANSEGFADVATDTLKEPAVDEAVADQIVNVLQNHVATADAATAVRPVLRQVVAEVVSSEAFKGLFHGAVREMHAAVVEGHRSRGLQVRVDDTAQLVKDALAIVSPDVADAIPASALAVPIGMSQNRWVDLFMRGADLAGWLILPFALGATTCFVLAVRRASDRRRALESVGLCLVSCGAVIFAVLAALLNVAADVGQDPRQRTALRAVFWSGVHVLNVTGKVLIVLGSVTAFAAALAGRGPLKERLEALGDSARAALARPKVKGAAAAAAFACGIVGLIWPLAMAEVAVRGAAVGLVVLGAVWVFDLVGASSWVAEREGTSRVTPRRLALGGTTSVATFSLVLLLGGMSFVRAVRAPGLDRESIKDSGCNTYAQLCDRRVDEVAFAGTHNSMAASAEPGWYTARQSGGILPQLSRGVRAFLLDLHYGYAIKDVVRTSLLSDPDTALTDSRLNPTERIKAAAVVAAFAIVGAEATPQNRKVYLCHVYCELGATLARDAFQKIHDWLRVNPNEVVILVLEDHVAAADAVKAMQDSGLADRAYAWTPGTPAPTLRQMIHHKKNVLVLVENHGGDRPWYLKAYGGLLQDTPYKFGDLSQLQAPASCGLGRGEKGAPLVLLNHWVDTGGLPSPTLAAEVNGTDLLQQRAEACWKARDHIPNIVAVDFYAKGELFRVVDRLNRVDVPDTMLAAAGVP